MHEGITCMQRFDLARFATRSTCTFLCTAVLTITAMPGGARQAPSASEAATRFGSVKLESSDLRSTGGVPTTRTRGGTCPPPFALSGARLEIGCATVAKLIGYAFRVPLARVEGLAALGGLAGARFNIEASLPPGASADQIPEMLQAVLEERFHLAAHRGARSQEGYALVVAPSGHRLKEASAPGGSPFIAGAAEAELRPGSVTHINGIQTYETSERAESGPGFRIIWRNPRLGVVTRTALGPPKVRWEAPSISVEGLADLLGTMTMQEDVVDLTGLKGRYQVAFDLSLSGAAATIEIDRPRTGEPDPVKVQSARKKFEDARIKALNRGLRKLGLQLEPRTVAREIVVVDRVEGLR
jgi:uncharacterized protein (TIGR03435 family)